MSKDKDIEIIKNIKTMSVSLVTQNAMEWIATYRNILIRQDKRIEDLETKISKLESKISRHLYL